MAEKENRLAEDTVEYSLFPVIAGEKQGYELKTELLDCARKYLTFLSPHLIDVIWQNEGFTLTPVQEKGPLPLKTQITQEKRKRMISTRQDLHGQSSKAFHKGCCGQSGLSARAKSSFTVTMLYKLQRKNLRSTLDCFLEDLKWAKAHFESLRDPKSATDAPTTSATDAPTTLATNAPTTSATDAPTTSATDAPTTSATDAPTASATDAATDAPTTSATDAPTASATGAPTALATGAPITSATDAPTTSATDAPTTSATDAPTTLATDAPRTSVTDAPTTSATDVPTTPATDAPTTSATDAPTTSTTDAPTASTTDAPTTSATDAPTTSATDAPITSATDAPTTLATDAPRTSVTDAPTTSATDVPTTPATDAPTTPATDAPTTSTTDAPTASTTDAPTTSATDAPTTSATDAPITSATDAPTTSVTDVPTTSATDAPITSATDAPTTPATDVPTTSATDAPTSATDVPTTPATDAPTTSTTDAPTASTTDAPTTSAKDAPTTSATDAPRTSVTDAPTTDAPRTSVTDAPTSATDVPTTLATDAPTTSTTDAPTAPATDASTTSAIDAPSTSVTDAPTTSATDVPTTPATNAPRTSATDAPTTSATDAPTTPATDVPTTSATDVPTTSATDAPTTSATDVPTTSATDVPTTSVTDVPTTSATDAPTTPATDVPTTSVTDAPTTPATDVPTTPATDAPTTPATDVPTTPATDAPTTPATDVPTTSATDAPTTPATDVPTTPATDAPTTPATDVPTTSVTDVPTTPATDAPTTSVTDAPTTPATDVPTTPATGVPTTSVTDVPTTPATDVPTTPATDAPTTSVTDAPTTSVTDAPTTPATDVPTTPATDVPTTPATDAPTTSVTDAPTTSVTDVPTTPATDVPTTPATDVPTTPATDAPTTSVTDAPTTSVTDAPTTPATDAPTTPATDAPTTSVTDAPTTSVTDVPTTPATDAPTTSVTDAPTTPATDVPTTPATDVPTTPATYVPTTPATDVPTTPATDAPTTLVTDAPTTSVTDAPTTSVTDAPTTVVSTTPTTNLPTTSATDATMKNAECFTDEDQIPNRYDDSEEDAVSEVYGGDDKDAFSEVYGGDDEDADSDVYGGDDDDYVEDSDFEVTEYGPLVKAFLPEKDIERDEYLKGIYIRKHRQSASSSRAQASRKKKGNTRVYNNYHACLYCGQLRQHLKPHLNQHKNIFMVKKLLEEKNPDLTQLRKLGDHKHNVQVLRKGCGEIILTRRPEILNISKFGPCPKCKEWLLLKNLRCHYTKCAEKVNISKRQLIVQSQVLSGVISTKPSPLMLQEVFPSMLNDNIADIAKHDKMIVALGESWLRRSIDNREKRRYYTSQHMRLMAKMLTELRKADNEGEDNKPLTEFLQTKHFDSIVQSALQCCLPHMDDIEQLQSPSNAIRLKYDLRRTISAKWAMLVKKDPHCSEAKEMQTLLELMNLEWGERLTKLARAVMVRRSFRMKKELPTPEDVVQLTIHVIDELKGVELKRDNYSRVVQLAQTRLLTYNKRRSGEIDAISLENFAGKTRDLDEMDQSLVGEMTKVEKYLLKSQDMMTVRGKGHRPVPVLIPPDVQDALEFVSSFTTRKKIGVHSNNRYLFPKGPRENGYTRSYDSLKKTCEECDLVAPGRITSVSMRKYTATLTQMLNLNSYQLEWMCRHLGHTTDVHKTFYRHMSGYVERVQLSKLFLLQDLNLTAKFKGKSLDEIDITGSTPAHLIGQTNFGDNVEDEWFIVYLLFELTKKFPGLVAKIFDSDEEFLLIEAANALPNWLNPETAENRVYIYEGKLHILPSSTLPQDDDGSPDGVTSIGDAVEFIRTYSNQTRASQKIQTAIKNRIRNFPNIMQENTHYAHTFLPAPIAAILDEKPQLVSAAVRAFYFRDPIDLQCCRTFKYFRPGTRVVHRTRLTRCLYAQLIHQNFQPDKRSGWVRPAFSSPKFKSHDLGIKLAHGFEILCHKAAEDGVGTDKNGDIDAIPTTDIRWQQYVKSLTDNNYFRGELEGSILYKQLLNNAWKFYQDHMVQVKQNNEAGCEIMRLLNTLQVDIEARRSAEATLLPPDDDSWLNLDPESLDNLLKERSGASSHSNNEADNDDIFDLSKVADSMKAFVGKMSSADGVEFPGEEDEEDIQFDGTGFITAMQDMFEFEDSGTDSSSDMDEYGWDDDSAEKGHKSKSKIKRPPSLDKYMDIMDRELAKTEVGKSFEKQPKPRSRSSLKGTNKTRVKDIDEEDDDFQPVDVDLNTVKNLLESYGAQEGLPGPASTILGRMGVNLPNNADVVDHGDTRNKANTTNDLNGQNRQNKSDNTQVPSAHKSTPPTNRQATPTSKPTPPPRPAGPPPRSNSKKTPPPRPSAPPRSNSASRSVERNRPRLASKETDV